MLFSRREPIDRFEKMRALIWPRRGWGRTLRCTWLRLYRAEGSPHAVALGVAAGIFATFLPVLGFQMTLAATLANVLRGSMVGALAGTFIGTPVTYPVMWIGSYRLGGWLLGRDAGRLQHEVDQLWSRLASGPAALTARGGEVLLPILTPLLIGSCVLGLAAALLAYYSLVGIISRLQARRRARLRSAQSAHREAVA